MIRSLLLVAAEALLTAFALEAGERLARRYVPKKASIKKKAAPRKKSRPRATGKGRLHHSR